MGTITFIFGGARSGKSSFAQAMAADSGLEVTFVATAATGDEEMRLRVARHRRSRPEEWRTVEEPLEVARVLAREKSGVVIVDCLTLLISNLLLERSAEGPETPQELAEREEAVMRETEDVLRECRRGGFQALLVSNETGLSVVPPTFLGRAFRDLSGRVNQAVAAEADEVYFLLAGLPQKLK